MRKGQGQREAMEQNKESTWERITEQKWTEEERKKQTKKEREEEGWERGDRDSETQKVKGEGGEWRGSIPQSTRLDWLLLTSLCCTDQAFLNISSWEISKSILLPKDLLWHSSLVIWRMTRIHPLTFDHDSKHQHSLCFFFNTTGMPKELGCWIKQK